eukprot:619380-Hanusia_phi.AAC.3
MVRTTDPLVLCMLISASAAFTLPPSAPPPSAQRKLALNARCSLQEAVVITGGTSGIGRAIAQSLLASTRYKVIVAGRGRKEEEDLTLAGASFLPLDLSDLDSVERAYEQLQAALQGYTLTRLVVCAGVFFSPQLLTKDGFESHFQVAGSWD